MPRLRLLAATSLLVASTACQNDNSLFDRNNPEGEPIDTSVDIVDDGLQPDIEVTPESISFDGLEPGCQSAPETVTVKNVGAAPLDLYDIRLVGDGPSAYILGGPPSGVLAPGEELLLSILFKPGSNLQYDAELEIESNDPDEAVTGTLLDGLGADYNYNEEIFNQSEPGPVDILWSIDASCSMSEEVNQLAAQFDIFINTFVNLGLDYQIGITTTDDSGSGDSGKLLGAGVISEANSGSIAQVKTDFLDTIAIANDGLGGEAGFGATKLALSEPLISTANAGFIREEATLQVIVVSDEPEQSTLTPTQYATWLDGVKSSPDDSAFSAVVADRTQGCVLNFSGSNAEPAPKYHDAIDATGGAWIDICKNDFAQMMTYLSYQAAGIIGTWPLQDVPVNQSHITVTIDGQDIGFSAINGWSYDASTNSVEFHGTAIPGPGTEIIIEYPVAGTCPTP